MPAVNSARIENYWKKCDIEALYKKPFMDVVFEAAAVHRKFFDPNRIQLSSLLSIKTGSCPENCAYCSQSAHYKTGIEKEALLTVEEVVAKAKIAKKRGADRFCMAAAWRGPRPRQMKQLSELVAAVKALGLETCGSFGLLEAGMANELKDAGLDYYNHNIDTSPRHYQKIIQTRQFDDRLNTIKEIQDAGIHLCCGGIIGLNEDREDRALFIASLANMEPQPHSVPINQLVPMVGTPLADIPVLDWTEFVRTIAVARIALPQSYIRLSAGRSMLDESAQALCFMAGANSIFFGEKILTADNAEESFDVHLMKKLDLKPKVAKAD